MATERVSIKFVSATLDEREGDIVLRGILDPGSLPNLKVAEYQREIQPTFTINKLVADPRKGGGA